MLISLHARQIEIESVSLTFNVVRYETIKHMYCQIGYRTTIVKSLFVWVLICWNIVHWTLRNKLQWNWNLNSNIFIEENPTRCLVVEMLSCYLVLLSTDADLSSNEHLFWNLKFSKINPWINQLTYKTIFEIKSAQFCPKAIELDKH